MKKVSFYPIIILMLFAFVSCEKGQLEPVPGLDNQIEFRGEDCFNFKSTFDGCLNVLSFEIMGETYVGFGATPAPGTVGDYEGYWASIVTEETQNGNGAIRYKLVHKFWDDDGDYFYTNDKAVCAPANGLSATCMINDQMTIMGGTGKFANASGKIKTKGPLTLGDPICPEDAGSLSLELHGRVCME